MLSLVEWASAFGIAASIYLYGREEALRFHAAWLGMLGALGFSILAWKGGIYGIATLNLGCVGLNAWNLYKWMEDHDIRSRIDD
jgi:hypothetical protein